MNRLHPRIQLVWLFHALITAGIIGGISTGITVYVGVSVWIASGIFGSVLILGIALAIARYRRWGYEIREDALYLERGVFTEVRTIVPMVRIQHVDSRRSPIERLIGLASTVVYTAGSRGADVRIPGLTPRRSQELQDQLKQLAIHAEGEDAV